MIDTYTTLCDKIKQAIKWFHQTQTSKYFLKIDDDSYVRVQELASWLEKTKTSEYFYMGSMAENPVWDTGKWADPEYKKDTNNTQYPLYANGASGYVINRNVTTILVEQEWEQLKCYANEDASLGLWMHNLINVQGRELEFRHAKDREFTAHGLGECSNTKYLVVGHGMKPKNLISCHAKMMKSINKERKSKLKSWT